MRHMRDFHPNPNHGRFSRLGEYRGGYDMAGPVWERTFAWRLWRIWNSAKPYLVVLGVLFALGACNLIVRGG